MMLKKTLYKSATNNFRNFKINPLTSSIHIRKMSQQQQLPLSPLATYELNSGHTIPIIGFGTYCIEPKDATQSVYNALKIGYRHIDSAQKYGNESEVIRGIAKFIEETGTPRSQIFYTTKLESPDKHGYEIAKKEIEKSILKAHEIDYIDLFLIHNPLSNKQKRVSSWEALQDTIKAKPNKVKSIGVSNYGVQHLEELYAADIFEIEPAVNQIQLHPFLTRKELVAYCKARKIALEAYSPLTRGIKFDDPNVVKLAKKYNKSPAQILARYVLQKGYIGLFKAQDPKHAEETFNIFDFTISEEDIKELTQDDDYFLAEPQFDPIPYDG